MENRKTTLKENWDTFLARLEPYDFMYTQTGDNVLPHCKDFMIAWENGYTGKYTFRKMCDRAYDYQNNHKILSITYIPRNEILFDCTEPATPAPAIDYSNLND